MFRGLTAVGLSVAIPLAALCAPLVHAHLDDHDSDHHDARVVHSHFSGHAASPALPAGQPTLGTHDDERVVSLQVFVAVAAASFDLPIAVPLTSPLAAPVESAAHQPVDVVHGHDPPHFGSLIPRAPPAFLS